MAKYWLGWNKEERDEWQRHQFGDGFKSPGDDGLKWSTVTVNTREILQNHFLIPYAPCPINLQMAQKESKMTEILSRDLKDSKMGEWIWDRQMGKLCSKGRYNIKVDMTNIPLESEVHGLEEKCILGRQGQRSGSWSRRSRPARKRGHRRLREWVLKNPYM